MYVNGQITCPPMMHYVMTTPLDKRPLPKFDYYLDESDSVIVVLRCEDGSVAIRSGHPPPSRPDPGKTSASVNRAR